MTATIAPMISISYARGVLGQWAEQIRRDQSVAPSINGAGIGDIVTGYTAGWDAVDLWDTDDPEQRAAFPHLTAVLDIAVPQAGAVVTVRMLPTVFGDVDLYPFTRHHGPADRGYEGGLDAVTVWDWWHGPQRRRQRLLGAARAATSAADLAAGLLAHRAQVIDDALAAGIDVAELSAVLGVDADTLTAWRQEQR